MQEIETKQEYELFDELRRCVVMWTPDRQPGGAKVAYRQHKTASEAEASNKYFIASRCPHFVWQKPEAVRHYVIKR